MARRHEIRRTRRTRAPEVPAAAAHGGRRASTRRSTSVRRWRGWIHAATFPVAIAAGIVLIVLAQGAAAKWACAVFMATSLLLFGNSALYHRFDWGPKTRAILKRIDHANILLLIAGHLHADRRARAADRQGDHPAVAGLGRRDPRHPVPRVLDRCPALAVRRPVSRARLGSGDVHARPVPGERRDDDPRRSSAGCSTPAARSSTR